MAQLVERLLSTPEVRGSITLIGILNITFMLTAIHLIFKLKNGANYIKYSFIISISIVTINFIVRLILGID